MGAGSAPTACAGAGAGAGAGMALPAVAAAVPATVTTLDEPPTEALMEAVFTRDLDLARLAIKAGADVNHKNAVSSRGALCQWLAHVSCTWRTDMARRAAHRGAGRHVPVVYGSQHGTRLACEGIGGGWCQRERCRQRECAGCAGGGVHSPVWHHLIARRAGRRSLQDGWTPLMYAASTGLTSVVGTLLDADKSTLNNQTHNVWHAAAATV